MIDVCRLKPARARRERDAAAQTSSAVLPPFSLCFRVSSDWRLSISTLSSRRFIFSYLEGVEVGGKEMLVTGRAAWDNFELLDSSVAV